MASLLRQIVAGPRARHPEAGLDLCYVTDNIIATSGPSQTYPQRAYRNPLDRLVAFLDSKHGENWAIWEFRGEGTGYPDDLVYGRIRHYPWPDHHPPPFRLVPLIVASMRNWLHGNDLHGESNKEDADEQEKKRLVGQVINSLKKKHEERVVVVHCKAGKGRSGTMACSYLIAECGWTPEQALARFTERRMRPKFGAGVSIPSQLRWVGYVDRWTHAGQKKYVDRELEIVEIHVWGLRNGVKVAVEGFIEDGRKIKPFHTYKKEERQIIEGDAPGGGGVMDMMYQYAGYSGPSKDEQKEVVQDAKTDNATPGQTISPEAGSESPAPGLSKKGSINRKTAKLIRRLSQPLGSSSDTQGGKQDNSATPVSGSSTPTTAVPTISTSDEAEPGGRAVIFRSERPVRVPTSDVNITLEKRSRAPASVGFTMVTAVAHVWFNAYFEGNGPEQNNEPDTEGVFEIDWDKMDGIKGSWQKGARAADKIAVVWRSVVPKDKTSAPTAPIASSEEGFTGQGGGEIVVEIPKDGEPVPQMQAADWKGANDEDAHQERQLGLRVQSPDSASVSQASSIKEPASDEIARAQAEIGDDTKGVRSDVDDHEDEPMHELEGKEASGSREGDTHKLSDGEKLEAYAQKLPDPHGQSNA